MNFSPHSSASVAEPSYVDVSNSSSIAELRRLATAIPSSGGSRVVSRKRKKSKGKQLHSVFNVLASRPQMRSSLTENQTVTATFVVPYVGYLTSSTLTAVYFAASFSMNQPITAALQYFDQYRIDMMEVWLIPTAAQGTTVFSTLATCIDLDDANVPVGQNFVDNHGTCIISNGGAGHYHKWVPHVAVAAYSGTFTGYGNEPPQFIDSASPGVFHYGFKGYVTASPVAIVYNLDVKYHVTLKAPGVQ